MGWRPDSFLAASPAIRREWDASKSEMLARVWPGVKMTSSPSASASGSIRVSQSSTRSVVVAYVSMTCTPFTSSIYATCEATGVPRDIPFGYDGSQPSLSPRYGPDPSGVGLYASGSYGLLAYPRPVWHGPVGRPWTGGSGCGEGP